MQNPSSVWLVMTTLPDIQTAKALAQQLVTSRAAACVHIGAPVQSVYRWQEVVEEATEIPLHIKTAATNYAQVEAMIKAQHPYDVPEIIAIPIHDGLPAYLNWVRDMSAPNSHA